MVILCTAPWGYTFCQKNDSPPTTTETLSRAFGALFLGLG